MRLRLPLVLGAVVLLLVSGCAPTPEPKPSRTPSSTPSATSSPTPDPVVAPTPAFDVTCDDVAAEMTGVVGATDGGVTQGLQVWSSPGWYPGPAQRMYDRAGGIACSSGGHQLGWEVVLAPEGRRIADGAIERQGSEAEGTTCNPGGDGFPGNCHSLVVEDDILVKVVMTGPGVDDDDAAPLEAAIRRLITSAVATQRPVELGESEIVGVPCARFLTAEEAAAAFGADLRLVDKFGGWGIDSEVYQVVNGARLCVYSVGTTEGDADQLLTITSLPGGAWGLEQLDGGTPIAVEGAEVAISGTDVFGRRVLDLRVGQDWIRLTIEDGAVVDIAALATDIVQNFTVGRPAPQ